MKKLLILPLLILLSSCVSYYHPETALKDGVYYAEDDPSYYVNSGAYRGVAYYPWVSMDYFYLAYYPNRYYWHRYPWYVDHYRYKNYWVSWPHNGYCSDGDCRSRKRVNRRDSGRKRYAANSRNTNRSSFRSMKTAAVRESSRSVSSNSGTRSTRASSRRHRE